MADWTDQDVDSLLPGEPWTSAKALAAFENPVALAEGAANAPRLWLRALERLEAGDEIRSRRDAVQSAPDIVQLHSFGFIQYGTVRCSLFAQTGLGIIERTRNGVTTTLATGGGSLVADVAVLPGDGITLSVGNNLGTAIGENARFSTNGQDLWPGVSVNLEGFRAAT